MRSGAYFFLVYFLLFGLMASGEIMSRTTKTTPEVFVKTQLHAVSAKRNSTHLFARLDLTFKTPNNQKVNHITDMK